MRYIIQLGTCLDYEANEQKENINKKNKGI